MSVKRTLLVVVAGATALAVLVGVGFLVAARFTTKSSATAQAAAAGQPVAVANPQVAVAERMKALLQPPDQATQQSTVQDAAAAGVFDVPANMTFAPKSCLLYLEDAIGSPGNYPGWVEFGTLPASATRFSDLAISVAGGVDLNRIQASAATCASGTMSIPSLGLTATVRLSNFATPTLAGARTLGITITTAFDPNSSAEARAAALGTCPVETSPALAQPDGTVVSVSCAAAAAQGTVPTTVQRYGAYLAYGDVLVEVCADTIAAANQMITDAYQRAIQTSG